MFKYCLLIFITLFFFSKPLLAQHYQFQKATYAIIEDSILVEKGKTIWHIEPPVYEITIEPELLTETRHIWKKMPPTKSCCCLSENRPCLVWTYIKIIPAKYQIHSTKTLKTSAHFKAVKEPDIYQKTKKIVKLSPAKLRKL